MSEGVGTIRFIVDQATALTVAGLGLVAGGMAIAIMGVLNGEPTAQAIADGLVLITLGLSALGFNSALKK